MRSRDIGGDRPVPERMEGRRPRVSVAVEQRRDRGSHFSGYGSAPHSSDPTAVKGRKQSNGRVWALGAKGADEFPDRGISNMGEPSADRRRLPGVQGRICSRCGDTMRRSSRMVLSPLAAFMLMILGAALMTGYGLATNFYETPWFLKFILPALYYVGSIFIAVGVLFFFIREKVWKCETCREISKR